jgi:hypothetical protein
VLDHQTVIVVDLVHSICRHLLGFILFACLTYAAVLEMPALSSATPVLSAVERNVTLQNVSYQLLIWSMTCFNVHSIISSSFFVTVSPEG